MMTQGRIEHVNLTVTDIEKSAALFEKLLGWRQRWRGPSRNGGETIHVGEDTTYLSLYSDGREHAGQRKGRPMNHVGLLVGDLDAAERVVREHQLEPWGHDDYEPGRRFYFFDWDGIEFEVVSYE
jgi:catechol 2,3-dioxygenase-like lactoylglutathione lyase family enzyme